MPFGFGRRVRHPLFPALHSSPAWEAKKMNMALYGTFAELIGAADSGARVRRAVFITVHENEPLPSDTDRDALWEMLQVPAYILLLDSRGRVAAYECEVQSGLHICAQSPLTPDVTTLCECGRPGGRLDVAQTSRSAGGAGPLACQENAGRKARPGELRSP
jgi:hypothetical protein